MPDSISLAGQPVAFDYECKIRDFLRDRMPPEQTLFARWMPAPKMHASIVTNYEALTPPYTPLPPIEIGELQWPSGASRYARALYLVDRLTMLQVAQAAWDYAGQLSLLADDVPSDWGIEKVAPIPLEIYGDETFMCSMLPLPPHR